MATFSGPTSMVSVRYADVTRRPAPSQALSGGVAPGDYLVPLQGTKNLFFGLTRGTPLLTSWIAAFGYPSSE